jgi:hypothetical protein
MSRTVPTGNSPSPVTRWFEIEGAEGGIRYYDKVAEKVVTVGKKFAFILLSRMATVKGWHEASKSGIYSNEVSDTKAERLCIKAHKGGELAEGFYSEIRDRIVAVGGYYTANLYCAYKDGEGDKARLKLGCLQLKGASLNAWVDFERENRNEIWKQAVQITGWTQEKKGKIEFAIPSFKLMKITKESDDEAGIIQEALKVYHAEYFKRTRVEQTAAPAAPLPPEEPEAPAKVEPAKAAEPEPEPIDDSGEVPF